MNSLGEIQPTGFCPSWVMYILISWESSKTGDDTPFPTPNQDCRMTGTQCQMLTQHAECRFFLLAHKALTDMIPSSRGTARRLKTKWCFLFYLDNLGTRKAFTIPLYSITWQKHLGSTRKLNFSGCYKENTALFSLPPAFVLRSV